MNSWIAPSILQILFYGILLLEFLIPSAGILTVLALGCLGYSWWLLIQTHFIPFWIGFGLLDLLGTPVVIWYGFKILQASPLTNQTTLAEKSTDSIPLGHQLQPGDEGIALSPLYPAGKVEIQHQVYEAATQTGYIEKDTPIRVVQVEARRLIVTSAIQETTPPQV